jgi:hypothetical protein
MAKILDVLWFAFRLCFGLLMLYFAIAGKAGNTKIRPLYRVFALLLGLMNLAGGYLSTR